MLLNIKLRIALALPFSKLRHLFFHSPRYQGGIGRALKDDYIMKINFLKSMVTGDKSELYYQNQGSIVYKIPIPRFLKKFWHLDRP